MIQSIKNTIKSKFPLTPGANGIDEEVAAKLKNASRNDSKFSFGQFESSAEGLSVEQAAEKLKEFGLNEVHHEKAPSWLSQLFHSFVFPFNAVLVVIAIISYITDVLIANPADRDYKVIAPACLISATPLVPIISSSVMVGLRCGVGIGSKRPALEG